MPAISSRRSCAVMVSGLRPVGMDDSKTEVVSRVIYASGGVGDHRKRDADLSVPRRAAQSDARHIGSIPISMMASVAITHQASQPKRIVGVARHVLTAPFAL